MCSGCFGEYEEDEDRGRALSGNDGPAHEMAREAAGAWVEVPDADQFEVLVGADSIIEIRRINCKLLGPRRADAGGSASESEFARRTDQQMQGQTANNYRTSQTQQYRRLAGAPNSAKWLPLMALAILSLAGLALWFLVV
jgi:hypothetical protein